MSTQSILRDRRGDTAPQAIIRSLLIVAAVACVVGLGSVGALRLAAAAAPQPVMAAPPSVERTLAPTPTPRLPEEPTVTPLSPLPEVGPALEGAEAGADAGTDAPEAAEAAEAAPAAAGTYQVMQGDTLAGIALAHGVTVADLVAANGLTDPDLIYTGQMITIPTSSDVAPTADPTVPPTPSATQPITDGTRIVHGDDGRWIDVDLSEQRLTAYEGSSVVRTTLVSTGLPQTPTPVGDFHIWIKLRYDDMAGPGYYIEDVPFVMYFHEGYGLHGVTWHGNFGQPMSHGCVNLPTPEAEWLFGWAEVGTLVRIHD